MMALKPMEFFEERLKKQDIWEHEGHYWCKAIHHTPGGAVSRDLQVVFPAFLNPLCLGPVGDEVGIAKRLRPKL